VDTAPARDAVATHGRVATLVALAAAALLLGTAVYVLDRGPGSIRVWPASWTGLGVPGAAFGAIGAWLPSFAHAFAFAVPTALLLAPRRHAIAAGCTTWAAIGTAFELGQHPWLAAPLADAQRGSLAALPGASPLAAYFARGTFDPADLVATVAGAAAAAVLLVVVAHRPRAGDARSASSVAPSPP
jgi:hypothetical protein